MNAVVLICLAVTAAAVLLAAAFALYQRRKARRLLQTLHAMLDAATSGSFSEQRFDETMLSAVETRFSQYLASSLASAHNLAAEKKNIEQLISDISHQTKTPLANILLYTQLLAERDLPADSRPLVEALSGQTQKLDFLIAALVKLSRLESGTLALHPKAVEVQPVLTSLHTQFAAAAQAKSIVLTVEDSPGLAVFDEKWTAEALANLLDNAIKYTPPGGTVSVRTTPYDLFFRIDVCDSGIGISEEECAKIFSRFYRSPLVATQEGVGIGLYLARQILAGQGGYLKVSSTPEGGSVFSAFLPCPRP